MQTKGNIILITGGGSGIGRALAEAFHALGNKVIIAGRRQSALADTVAANPGMRSVPLDVADPAAIRDLAAKMAADHPALNVLINNAGMAQTGRPDTSKALVETSFAEWQNQIAITLHTAFRVTRAVLPGMMQQNYGRIVNVTSVTGPTVSNIGSAAYGAA